MQLCNHVGQMVLGDLEFLDQTKEVSTCIQTPGAEEEEEYIPYLHNIIHILGFTVLSLCYFGWAFVGYIVCKKYGYFFFNHDRIGWEYVGIAIVGFVVLSNICK